MTTPSNPAQPEPAISSPSQRRPKKNTTALQFKCMMILTIGFFAEVLVYSITPEGLLKGLSVTALSLLVTWCMFKFAIND